MELKFKDATDISTKSCSLESRLGGCPVPSAGPAPWMQTGCNYRHVVGACDSRTWMKHFEDNFGWAKGYFTYNTFELENTTLVHHCDSENTSLSTSTLFPMQKLPSHLLCFTFTFSALGKDEALWWSPGGCCQDHGLGFLHYRLNNTLSTVMCAVRLRRILEVLESTDLQRWENKLNHSTAKLTIK